MQKGLKTLAAGPMPNFFGIEHDHSSKILASTQEPLVRESAFSERCADLFEERSAWLTDIKRSEKWSEKFRLCEASV